MAAVENSTPSGDDRPQRICLVILAVVAVGVTLYLLRPVLLPLLFALFLYLCLTPLIDFQVGRLHFPYKLALATTALLSTLILLLVIAIAAASVAQMASDVSLYQTQLNTLVERVTNAIPFEKIGVTDARNYLRMSEGTVSGFLSTAVYEFSSLISNAVFVVILTVFILLGRQRSEQTGLISDLETNVRRYISGAMMLSVLTGFFVGVALSILRVPYSFVFGLFAMLLNFIPLIGPVVATLLPLPLVMLSPELSTTAKFLAVLVPGFIEFVMGQIVSPKVIGRSLALHPVTVLLFLLFFQMIWGVGGAFLSTPIAAVVKILFEQFSATRPVAALLAGELGSLGGRRESPLLTAEQV